MPNHSLRHADEQTAISCVKSTSTSYQSYITNHYIPVIILVMSTGYISTEVDLHLPLSLGNENIDSHSTAPVLHVSSSNAMLLRLFSVSIAFMDIVNHWCTLFAHCELRTADQTQTNNTFIRPRDSVIQTRLCFQTWGEDPLMMPCDSWFRFWPVKQEFRVSNSKSTNYSADTAFRYGV